MRAHGLGYGINMKWARTTPCTALDTRCEGVIAMTVGRGIWNDAAGETNVLEPLTRQATKFPQDTHVGNVTAVPTLKVDTTTRRPIP
jgi:hypothetical protein